MKKHRVAFLFFVIIMVLLTAFPASVVSAQTSTPVQTQEAQECFSLDVIFIIDQSDSMSYAGIGSDPTEQREKAVEAMANFLIENALDHCKTSRHQIGVVSFGTNSQIDFPLTEISPKSFEASLQLKKQLENSIMATKLGQTNPIGAFQLARKMLNESGLKGAGLRKQVIVMLTDGVIYTGESDIGVSSREKTQVLANYIDENFSVDPVLRLREACIQEQISAHGGDFDFVPYAKINECMQAHDVANSAYLNSTYLYIILMNTSTIYEKASKDIYQSVAEKHMGTLMDFQEKGIENRNAIPDYFRSILSEKVGIPSGRVSCGPLAVNPYLEKATFVFYKFSADTIVNIYYSDAAGKRYEISNNKANDPSGFNVIEYESVGPNERYTFKNPYPGIWYIDSDRCSSNGVSAYYQEVQINPGGYALPFTTIQQYDIEPYYDPSDPYYLTVDMMNENNQIVRTSPNPFFKVDLMATVTDPKGKSVDYTMVWNETNGKFVATQALQVERVGEYQVSYTGSTPYYPGNKAPVTDSYITTFSGKREILHYQGLSFTVNPVKPFKIVPDKPEDGQKGTQIHQTILGGWPLKIKPIDVVVDVAWRDQKLDRPISDLVSKPDRAFTAWIEFPDGRTTEPIFLKISPDEPTKLVGSFEGIDSKEPMIIHVELVGEVNPDYRPDIRHTQIHYSRADKTIFTLPGFYKTFVLILIIVSLGSFVYQIISHYDPVTGRLIFVENNLDVYDVDVFTGKHKTKLNRREIAGYDLRSMTLVYKSPYRQPKPDEYDPQEARTVQIVGKTACGKQFDMELVHGTDNSSYCLDHNDYQVRYISANPEQAEKPYLHIGLYMLTVLIPVALIVIFILM